MRYRIDNEDEFDAESEFIETLNELALEFWEDRYAGKETPPKRGTKFHSSPTSTHQWAWRMACIASGKLVDEHKDPNRVVDALNDFLNAQDDPCEADKAARLDAA